MPFVIASHQQGGFFTPALIARRERGMRDLAEAWYEGCPDEADHVERVMAVDRGLWLVDDLLQKVDRASMAYGLEARVPYLDPDLLDLVRTIPSRVKLDGGRCTKAVLKGIAGRYLPPHLVHRRKQGFSMPLGAWLREDLRDLCGDALGEGGLARRGLLRPSALRRMWHEHRDGRKGHGHRLWALLMLELWLRKYQPDFVLDSRPG
jgi:asparagine synthase (glutamine-hydrolysing)